MSQSIADLAVNVDVSDVDKGRESLAKLGDQTKQLITALESTVNSLSSFERETTKVNGALKDVVSSFNPAKLAAGALAGAISALSLGALKDMVSGVIDGAAELNNLSKQTGLTVEQLSVMKSIAGQSGTSMETVTGAVVKFEKSLAAAGRETSLQAKAFKELGINTSDTSKSTEEYMSMSAQKLEGLQDGWQKNNIVMALFGKTGTEVNEFLSDYANKGDMAAKVSSEQAEQAEQYERTMKRLGATTNQYKQLVGMALMPVMQSIADQFLKMVTTTGKLDGETKKLISNTVQDWAFGLAKGIGAAIDVGIAFWNVLKGLGMALGTLAGGVVGFGEVLDDVLHGRFDAAKSHFTTNVQLMKDGLSDAWKTASADSSKYFDLVTKAQQEMGKSAAPAAKTATRLAGNIGDQDAKDGKDKQGPSLDNELKGLQKRLELQSNLYEADALRQMIDKGYYDKYDQKQVQELLNLQKQVDAQERLNAQKKLEVEAVQKMQDVYANDISARVMMQYGKTATDAALAVNQYRISMEKQRLEQSLCTAQTEKEVDAIKDKIKALEGERAALTKQGELEKKRTEDQRSFESGWKNAFAKYQDDATNAAKIAGQAFDSLSSNMESALDTFVKTGKMNFKDFTASILGDIAKIIEKQLVAKALGAAMGAMGFANGGAFGGGMQLFANGDVFSSPTTFPMSGNKTGMLGEAGPEAIMPLTRGQDGKLGVKAAGNGGGAVQVNNQMSVTINGNVDSQERVNQITQELKNMMVTVSKQTMADQMRQGGMLSRRPA